MPRYLVERELGADGLAPTNEEETEIWCVVIDGDAAGCTIWAPGTGAELGRHYSVFEAPRHWVIGHGGAGRRREQQLADSLRLEAIRHR